MQKMTVQGKVIGKTGVATFVQGAIVKGDSSPRGLLSKETFFQVNSLKN